MGLSCKFSLKPIHWYVLELFLHFQKIWVLSKNGGVGSYTCDGAMLHHALQNLRRQRFPRVADPCLSTIRLWVKIGYPIRWLIPNMYIPICGHIGLKFWLPESIDDLVLQPSSRAFCASWRVERHNSCRCVTCSGGVMGPNKPSPTVVDGEIRCCPWGFTLWWTNIAMENGHL